MDKNFDWDGFKKGEFVVHVKTQEEYDELIEACKEHGINTCSAKSNLFNIYKENTCIGATISYCEYDWYAKNDIKIVEFEQEKEPAPAATDTSSEVKTLHLDDTTKSVICQVLSSAMSTMMELYQEMSEEEQKAFDLGTAYKDICFASAEL